MVTSCPSKGTWATNEDGLGVLAISHYARLLNVLKPDLVHVLADGRIAASGGPKLGNEFEETGYVGYGEPHANAASSKPAASDPFA